MMRNILPLILVILTLCLASPAYCANTDVSKQFGSLSEVESALKKIGKELDEITGSESQPDRVFALQDLANMCQTSRMQVHGINSLYSAVNIIKGEKKFENKTALMLKEKCGYAVNDFLRRKTFVSDITIKAKNQKLRDLAYILKAQLEITLKRLAEIKKELQ